MEKLLKATNVESNEVIKAEDVNSGYEFAINNVIIAMQSILDTSHTFVIGGEVSKGAGGNLVINPVFGVNVDNDSYNPVVDLSNHPEVSISLTNPGRIDTLMIRGTYELTTPELRSFIDFDSNSKNLIEVDTRKALKLEYKLLTGVSDTAVAPSVESGWIKIAEIVIPASATDLSTCTINGITADAPGTENKNWTNDKTATYNLKTISDLRSIFRGQHNIDGSHVEGCIGKKELNLTGTDGNKIAGNLIENGGTAKIKTYTYGRTEVISDVLKKLADAVTPLYEAYQKNGNYKFQGEVLISKASAFDESTAIKIKSNGDNSASILIGSTEILKIQENKILVSENYNPSTTADIKALATINNVNTVDSKVTTNTENISQLQSKVAALENSGAVNKVFGMFTFGQEVDLVTTESIVLSGFVVVDSVTVQDQQLVLVKDQENKKDNGIYKVTSGAWERQEAIDMINKFYAAKTGASNKGILFYTPATEIVYGTTDIEFLESLFSINPISHKVVTYNNGGGITANSLTASTSLIIPTSRPSNVVAGSIWIEG